MRGRRAIVIGAGLGGLAAAAALRRRGWAVHMYEKGPWPGSAGAGLAMMPNALRALDAFGAGDTVRGLAAIQGDGGLRRADGRYLARTSAAAVQARFGDPMVVLERTRLAAILRAAAADVPLRADTPAAVLHAGDAEHPAVVRTAEGDEEAELVVAADGVHSAARGVLFPDHPGTSSTGWTAWRFIVAASVAVQAGETWGGAGVVGLVPLADDRTYFYAAAVAPAGERAADDERAELLRRFGHWHAPIRQLIESAVPASVLRGDIAELAAPLTTLHRGRVALLGDAAHPMAPFLGQGACQAIEDAVVLADALDGPDGLVGYTAARHPRTTDIVRRSHRMGTLALLRSPVARALRDTFLRTVGSLSSDTAIRQLIPVVDWRPPTGDGAMVSGVQPDPR
ncbi:FAD-dependent monooxygenase [Microbacterium sp. NPDC057650]|uniref:FAD-dependent monooxygenase n=1 Tax=unclassified Microbacterium TaxID=2609290 RepID=UPI00366EED7A